MNKQTLYIIASLLILIGLVLLVIGLPDQTLLWQVGLGAVGLAMVASFATRWAPSDKEPEETSQSQDEEA